MDLNHRDVAVLIGTGFHRWVLGAGANSPLCDWSELLKRVAYTLRVALPEHGPQSDWIIPEINVASAVGGQDQ